MILSTFFFDKTGSLVYQIRMDEHFLQSILNVTSSCRFPGSLNVDLNEITMNLVPFPRMHYLTTCLSPLFLSKDLNLPIRRLDEMFTSAFSVGILI